MVRQLCAGALVALLSSGAVAQQGNYMMPAAPPRAASTAAAKGPVLKAGTEIPLKLADSAKGKKLGVGERVPLAVASDVKLGTAVVIPAGSLAEGEVTAVRGASLAARALYVRVAGKTVRLTGTFDGARGQAFLGQDVSAAK